MSLGTLIEFYFKLIICITIPEEPKIVLPSPNSFLRPRNDSHRNPLRSRGISNHYRILGDSLNPGQVFSD
ncbi:MAG: hypothetical protein DWQ54_01085 [Microcystis flos-aquae TF09]|uniref:Uncharacterized protein n=1 Tax=Microcystis flos-aquae TF09 TaxID=2060473 RepID=A0A3E0LAN3_9CHRO|nr:MAG: hypothetical protein DWQ54_01085 [Microcystis flos-aquae TF09]